MYNDTTLSEAYWNEPSTAANNPYSYSKVAAERKARKMHDAQSRWDLVVVNPGLVIGASLSLQSASGSLYMLEGMYRGEDKSGVPKLHYPIADVRDVAEAHIRAVTSRSAKGRYIVASDSSDSQLDMANLIRPYHRDPKVLPTRNLPKLMIYAAGPFVGLSMD